jgi:hypothetical protein
MTYAPNVEYYLQIAEGKVPGKTIVNKFGSNSSVPNGVFELVSSLSVPYDGFLSAPSTIRIKAGGSPADTAAGAGAQSVFVEGIDDSLARVVVEIPTAGASASAATTELFWRVDRTFVGDAGTYATPVNTGAIMIENSAGSADLIDIVAGAGQSTHCFVAVPGGVEAYLVGYELSVDAVQKADLRLVTRARINDTSVPVAPRLVKRNWDGVLGPIPHQFQAPTFLLTGPGEIYIEAAGGGSTTKVSTSLDLILVTP